MPPLSLGAAHPTVTEFEVAANLMILKGDVGKIAAINARL